MWLWKQKQKKKQFVMREKAFSIHPSLLFFRDGESDRIVISSLQTFEIFEHFFE